MSAPKHIHIPSNPDTMQTVCTDCQATIFNEPGTDIWYTEDERKAWTRHQAYMSIVATCERLGMLTDHTHELIDLLLDSVTKPPTCPNCGSVDTSDQGCNECGQSFAEVNA